MRVLIIDDSATMRKIIKRNLRQAGIDVSEVLEAGDGAEGLDTLKGEAIDLIFSDVNMPNMNGIEFLDAISADEDLSKIPVIMITTESSPDSVKTFADHGASGCVGKPFTPDQIEAVVSSIL